MPGEGGIGGVGKVFTKETVFINIFGKKVGARRVKSISTLHTNKK